MHHDRVWFISGIHCWLNIGKWIDTIYLIKQQQQQQTPHGHSNRGSPLLPPKSIEHNPVSVSNTYYWQTGTERISTTFYRVSAKKKKKTLQLTSKIRRNRTRVCSLTILVLVLGVLARTIRKEKAIKGS